MKKLFTILAVAATLVSCAKEDVVREAEGEAIQFGNAFVENSTRAAVDPSYGQNGEDLTKFQVWGTVSGGNGLVAIYNGNDVVGVVGSTTVDGKTTPNIWTCGVTQYWIKDAIYNFAALVNAPTTEGAVELTDYLPTKVNGFTADGATDLLYARSAVDIKGKASGNDLVDFTFEHLLSKVKFTVVNNSKAAEAYSFKVNGITITGNSVGNVALASKEWSNLDTPESYSVKEISVDKNTANAGQECEQELLLIPGEFNIAFNVDIYNGTTKLGSQAYPISPATYKHTLQSGYSYNFIINVAVGEEIQFSVEKQPEWGNGGDTTLLQ